MKKNLLVIYALSVCFVLAACFSIVFSIMLYDILELSFPDFTLSSIQHERHQSDTLFLLSLGERENISKKLSKKQIPKLREESYQIALLSERRDAKQSLLRGGITIFVSSLFFWIHWRLARRSRN